MNDSLYSAFCGPRLLRTGSLRDVVTTAFPFSANLEAPLLIFDHSTGLQLDFDWRGSAEEVLARLQPPPVKTGPGRPKLGVVSTEVTLLPRHWDWLNAQPTRASGTLRRLVEEAMSRQAGDPKRQREILGKILWSLAGNEAGFEEACRALYSGDLDRLKVLTSDWTADLPSFVKGWVEALHP